MDTFIFDAVGDVCLSEARKERLLGAFVKAFIVIMALLSGVLMFQSDCG